MEFLDPWWDTSEQTADFHAGFAHELQSELGPDHPLFGIPVKLIARHNANDDALFGLLDGSDRVAVVHLTWANHPEPSPWPATEIYANLQAWAEERMMPDYEDYKLS